MNDSPRDRTDETASPESLMAWGADNLVDLLGNRAHEMGAKNAFVYLEGTKLTEKPISYQRLDHRARAIGSVLQKKLNPGDRALLLYDCDLDYIAGFFGCLYAGVIAVPVYIPTSAKHVPRMNQIIINCDARLILTTTGIHHLLSLLPQDQGSVQKNFLTTDDISDGEAATWERPDVSGRSLAFLQYTSGSTGDPRGVMLTHQNLLANMEMGREAFEFDDSNEIQVSWLPLYHDMGLIGGIIMTIMNKRTTILMHPMSIVKPLNWLKTLSKYKATATAAPNFAYDLCIERVTDEEAKSLDLSNMKIFMSGAEPVRAQTMNAFYEKFKVAGVKHHALCPAYGLAEATVLVSTKKMSDSFRSLHLDKASIVQGVAKVTTARDQSAQVFVSCGKAAGRSVVAIYDPETMKPVADMTVGEVWTRGRHIAQGYWQNPQASNETFVEVDGHRWLRTGDMGFMDADKEIYVVGRRKDILILRGKNYAPQDLEETVRRSHKLINFAVSAAFSIDRENREQVVIAQEVPPGTTEGQLREIEKAAREALSFEHGLALDVIHFVENHVVPRTSSGKIRRRETKSRYLANKLKPYKESILTGKGFTKIKKTLKRNSAKAFLWWKNSREPLLMIAVLIGAAILSQSCSG